MEDYENIKNWLIENGYDNNDIFTMTIDNLAHTIQAYIVNTNNQNK